MAGLGRKVFTRETLGSADVNGYLMDQVLMRFASAAARTAAIAAPTEGMHTYLDDVNRIEVYDGATWRVVADFRQRIWTFARGGNAEDGFASGSFVVLAQGTIVSAPVGEYQILSRQVISNTSAGAGFQKINAGGVDQGSNPRADIILGGSPDGPRHTFVQVVGYTHAGGNLTVQGSYQASGGSPKVHSQGTELVISFLGPR